MANRLIPSLRLLCYQCLLCFVLWYPSVTYAQSADVLKAIASEKIGEYDQAIALAKEQVDKKTWNEAWPRILASNYLTLGRNAEALATYESSIERFSDSLRLRLLGHRIYLANNLKQKADKLVDDLTAQIQRNPWRYSTKADLVPLGEFFLIKGEDPKQVLKLCFDQAVQADPKNIEAYKAIATMALEKSDAQVAADALQKALKIDEEDPQLNFLASEAWTHSDPNKSADYLQRALELNPKHIPSLLKRAQGFLNAENYETSLDVLKRIESINGSLPELWALRAAIAHLQGDYKREGECRSQALAEQKLNPIVDALIGKHLSIHYRFAEGAQYQERALKLDPNYQPAKTQLVQDLLRLGRESEGWKLLKEARTGDPFQVTSYNLQLLKGELDRYSTIEAPGFLIRMDASEAKVFGKQVVEVLSEARKTLVPKYQATLEEPIIVELFSKQRDFAIRTFGLPGGQGFLGVCFGRVITANSPTALSIDHNWQSVLWHEYCHVVTLNRTKNRMPRWLSEGISVYEERMRNPGWGEPLQPTYLQWLREGNFEPPSQMSQMFLAPKSPRHLQFAYFVASLIVEYWIENFGQDGLVKLLDDLQSGLPISDAIARRVGNPAGIDMAFLQYAKRRGAEIAPSLSFSAIPENIQTGRPEDLEAWLTENPQSYQSQHKRLDQAIRNKRWEDAMRIATKLENAWPEDPSAQSALAKKGLILREQKLLDQEREVLVTRARIDPHEPEIFRRLIEIDQTRADDEAIRNSCLALLHIHPNSQSVLETLATCAEHLESHQEAIDALESLLALDPLDPAEVHYRLANAYRNQQQGGEMAKRHCLMALEESPRYEKALRLLLELQ